MANATQPEADALVARIKSNFPALREAVERKEPIAVEVYKYYDWFARCPEHGALLLCNAALDRWETAQGGVKEK